MDHLEVSQDKNQLKMEASWAYFILQKCKITYVGTSQCPSYLLTEIFHSELSVTSANTFERWNLGLTYLNL